MSAIIRTLKTKENGTEQNVYPVTVLEAVVNAESNQSLDAILGTKPENVSELFNFNKYTGDINSLAVGMYVYIKNYATVYSSPNVTTAIGAFSEGWCKINTVYPEYNSCYVLQTQLFGKQGTSTYTTAQYIKAEDILFILTAEEAKYLGMLSSVWGATQGGLINKYADRLSGTGKSYSFSLSASRSFIAIGYIYGPGHVSVFIGTTYLDNSNGGTIEIFKNISSSTGMSVSKSGATITLASTQSSTMWNVVRF